MYAKKVLSSICDATESLRRKKPLDGYQRSETRLRRCLSTFELTLIGIGSTVGLGLYVIAAEVAKEEAGPSIVISFTIAGIVSLFSALCYAEMACVIPKTGSAYTFAYVTCGEFIAFFVGWNMLMEMVIGTAGIGRATSQYVDSCFDNRLSAQLTHYMAWWPSHLTAILGQYPDLLAFACVLAVTGVLLLGVKASSRFNVTLTILNVAVLVLFIITGCFFVDFKNLYSPDGFLPHGVTGMLSGAASCFYAFVGFDCITTMSEESNTPAKSIPKAIILTLLICYVCYFLCSFVLVLVLPYSQIPSSATLAEIFEIRDHLTVIKYIVDVGAILALVASLVGGLLPIPRILYAIAHDGLLPPIFGEVWDNNEIPTAALLTCGLFSAVFALAIDLGGLVEMMSIGTLIAYTVVAISVILLRYNPEFDSDIRPANPRQEKRFYSVANNETGTGIIESSPASETSGVKKTSSDDAKPGQMTGKASNLFEFDNDLTSDDNPTVQSYRLVVAAVLSAVVCTIPVAFVIMNNFNDIIQGDLFYLGLIVVLKILIGLLVLMIASQPQIAHEGSCNLFGREAIQSDSASNHFRVPFVPYFPMAAVFFNLCLIAKLHSLTWIRFVVWCCVGLVIYFGYGVKNSNLNTSKPSTYHLVNIK